MPYRVELASTGRAGCKNTDCKKAGIRIDKGELRYGTLVTIQDHTSWTWKHWGCVTPQQIGNLKEASGGDTDMVDGYDELPAELQEKVKKAIEEGHVADEDWRGDVEMNREGQKGMHKKAPRKSAGKGKDDEEDNAEDIPAPKKRGRPAKAKVEDDDEEADAPAPKKRGRPAKAKVENDDEEADAPAPKKRGRPSKVKPENDEEEADAPAPKKRGRPAKAKDEEKDEEAPATKKRGRPAKVAKEEKADAPAPKKRGRPSKVAAESASDASPVEEAEEVEAEKPKRGRPKGTPKPTPKSTPQKRGRPRKSVGGEE